MDIIFNVFKEIFLFAGHFIVGTFIIGFIYYKLGS